MEFSNDKENNSINLDFSNLDMIAKDNKEEQINDNENEDINLSKIDFEDSNDLYMPDEKLDLSKNKNDIIEELVNEIKMNNKKSVDSNNDVNNLKNIFGTLILVQNLPLIIMKHYQMTKNIRLLLIKRQKGNNFETNIMMLILFI